MDKLKKAYEQTKKAIAANQASGNFIGNFITWFFSWGYGAFLATASIFMVITVVLTIILAFEENKRYQQQDCSCAVFDIDGDHQLTDSVLKWEDDVKQELQAQGLPADRWLLPTLGIIQAESDGREDRLPDIMQSSESQGLAMNTISDPQESIKAGVSHLSNVISLADENDITDQSTIYASYNFGTNFIHWMVKNGYDRWDIDMAEKYSRTVVFPAVTGRPASEATEERHSNPWSKKAGKEYYIRNGGNFHYANNVNYVIGNARADGNCSCGGVGPNNIQLDGEFALPFAGDYVVTSEYGIRWGRLHSGIDLVPYDDNIRATADGVVAQAQYGHNSGRGNMVVLDHGVYQNSQLLSTYFHLNEIYVKEGDKVKQGDLLGLQGWSGGVLPPGPAGKHLHFEYYFNPVGSTALDRSNTVNPREVRDFK